MGLRGYIEGVPVFDRVEDVPEADLERGVRFYVVADNAPLELEDSGMAFYKTQSPILWSAWEVIGIIAICVAVIVVAIAFFFTMRVIMVESHQGRKLDENTYEAADGCLYERDVETGKWSLVGCPSALGGIGGIIIIVLGLIAVMLIVWGLWKSGVFKAGAKKIEASASKDKAEQAAKAKAETERIEEKTKKIKARTAKKKAALAGNPHPKYITCPKCKSKGIDTGEKYFYCNTCAEEFERPKKRRA